MNERRRKRHPTHASSIVAVVLSAAASVSCARGVASTTKQPSTTALRVGISAGQLSATNPIAGTRQIVQNLTTEGLARVAEDGKMEPQLADRWVAASDGQSLKLIVKPGLKFHDGSNADAAAIAALLPNALRGFAGSLFEDVDRIEAADQSTIQISYRRPSPLLLEALEVPIRKPGAANVATGPFMATPGASFELRASPTYKDGRPAIDVVTMTPFPSVRSAWAELLRGNIDMLYEVGSDALDSLESSTSVSLFTFTRRYQYAIAFNNASPVLSSPIVRRAINLAIDRQALVQRALNGHGIPSNGPIWPKYWALSDAGGHLAIEQQRAAEMLRGRTVRFTCLVFSDPVYERVALELKRQLSAVGVDINFKTGTPDELFEAEKKGAYDAILTEVISGPTLFRLYVVWHSTGAANVGGRGNRTVDVALDRVRRAANEREYRDAITTVEAAFVDDPPAALLAWSERARAVSRHFSVPAPEPGADVLRTLRLWRARNDELTASRN